MIHLLVNPLARFGSRRRLVDEVRRGLHEDVCVCPFPFERHLADRCRNHASDRILLVGGDGTVNRVINALGTGGPALAVLAGGTANDLAGLVGAPWERGPAVRLARSRRVRGIDLVSVNGKLFATCGGIGLPARAVQRAERWRRGRIGRRVAAAAGAGIYPLAALRETLAGTRPLEAEIECEGRRTRGRMLAVLVANQARLGARFLVSPDASHRDGRLDLCTLAMPRGREWGALLRELRTGRISTLPFARTRQARSFTLRTSEAVPFFGDGEILCHADTFHVRTLPSALRVVDPRGEEVSRAAA